MLPPIETVPAKTIVTRTKSSEWFGTDYNMNLYRGCCHGCIYCDSRSDCYRIDHFDQVRIKENALQIVRDDLRRKVKPGVVGTGSMSDPYNPYERELEATRHALELLAAFGFGAAIATKGTLITRDIDILQEIRAEMPVVCKLTITTCDDALSRRIEPGAPLSSERFHALAQLIESGLFAGILLMSVLPFLEDTPENVLGIIARAAQCGAKFIYPAFGMTLRENQREWYLAKLDALFPGEGLRAQYERQYRRDYRCVSRRAKELWGLFSKACEEAGILYQMQDIVRASRLGYEGTQLKFF